MVDWAGGSENRNYGIKRITDPQKLSELLWIIFSLVMVAGALLFYAWIRSQIISVGYKSQQLQVQEQSLLHVNEKLIVQEAILKDPGRIDYIARNDLGMIRLRTNQIITPQFQDVEAIGPNTLAVAHIANSSAEERKGPATN
jgi:cell division protein FtsL